jgi:hypothetical protein
MFWEVEPYFPVTELFQGYGKVSFLPGMVVVLLTLCGTTYRTVPFYSCLVPPLPLAYHHDQIEVFSVVTALRASFNVLISITILL